MFKDIQTFFTKEECDDIANICEQIGFSAQTTVSVKNKWDNRRIHNDEFKQRILSRYKEVFANHKNLPFDINELTLDTIYITLSRYFDGRFLEMHRDTISDLTTVIVLTDDFADGRFLLSDTNIKIEYDNIDESLLTQINKGDGISFDGHRVWHGVMPVTKGIRKSLNIWIKMEKFKLQIGDKDIEIKNKKSFL